MDLSGGVEARPVSCVGLTSEEAHVFYPPFVVQYLLFIARCEGN
jgi:hypothetical protein